MITGSRGFVGKSLTKYLSQKGHNVIPVTRDDFNHLNALDVESFINKTEPDFIIHCANEGGSRLAEHEENPNHVINNNLKMFFNLERCLTSNMKMIHFGSGAEYNKQRKLSKINESDFDDVVPYDEYGYSKYLISKYIANTKKNLICLRIFGLFGENEDYRFKFITNAIVKNLLKIDIVINQNVFFDYLYIKDFVRIIEVFIGMDSFPKNKIFNITPDESIDLNTIVEYINQCSDHKSNICIKNEGLNYEYSGSNKKLKRIIGDFCFTDNNKAIFELYSYFKNNIDILDVETICNDEFLKYCKSKQV